MRFETDLHTLKAALATATAVIPGRPLPPIIGGLRLDVDPGQVQLTGSNYDVTARVTVDAAVEKPGSVIVPGQFFHRVVASFDGSQPLFVEQDDAVVSIRCGRAAFRSATLPLGDYPALPGMPPALGTITAADLTDTLPTLLRCISTDTTLPAVTCAMFRIGADEITMVATDRYRLNVTVIPFTREHDAEVGEFLVYGPMLATLAKAIAGGDDKIVLALTTDQGSNVPVVGFGDSHRQVTGRIHGSEYVKWQTFLKPAESTAIVPAAALAAAVGRVALADEGNKVPVTLTFRDGRLLVSAGGMGPAAGTEEIDGVEFNGEPGTARTFRASWLQDGLVGVHAERVRIGLGPDAPKKGPSTLSPAADGETCADPLPGNLRYRYVLVPWAPVL